MRKCGRYLFIFLFVFCIYEFFGFPNMLEDSINNYMFSHAIVLGEVPYLDFNVISTSLYAFVMSLGLFIWDNYLMFILEQSLLVTIMFYFLFELYGRKSYFVLLGICVFGFWGINTTYNFMVLFFLVVLLYLEKKYPNKDYLIGVMVGCAILSKHVIGIFFILPSIIYYFKDVKKLCKRFVGLVIPCLIFFFYLFINGALYHFIDLCFLGLFDFSSKNGNVKGIYVLFGIVMFCIQLFIIIKKKENILNYYLVMGIFFLIPLLDFHHFSIYVICFIIQLLPFLRYKENYFGMLSVICSIVVSLVIFINYCVLLKPVFSTKISHFQYNLLSHFDYVGSLGLYHFFDQYENKLLLTYSSIPYNISRNNPITYFDILMYGNYGYNGSYKMIDRIRNMKDIYIIVDMNQYKNDFVNNQFDKIIVDYVVTHYKEVDAYDNFKVYYKN